jgi:hypothetical protein
MIDIPPFIADPAICGFDYDTVNVQESGINDFLNALRVSARLEGAPPPSDASYCVLETFHPVEFTPQSDLADQCQRLSMDWRELKEFQGRHVSDDTRSAIASLTQRVFALEVKSGGVVRWIAPRLGPAVQGKPLSAVSTESAWPTARPRASMEMIGTMSLITSGGARHNATQVSAPTRRQSKTPVFAGEKRTKREQIATRRAIGFQDDYEQPKPEAPEQADAEGQTATATEAGSGGRAAVPPPIDAQADRSPERTRFASEPSPDQLGTNASSGADACPAVRVRGLGQGCGDVPFARASAVGFGAGGGQAWVGFGGASKPAGGVPKGQLAAFPSGFGPGSGTPGRKATGLGTEEQDKPPGSHAEPGFPQGSGTERTGFVAGKPACPGAAIA